ncbi:MAG: alpha/beta fold hydrolase [Caldilineae bacterium]|nr:MAG: alpha/beta fold hydrolase [Caldilineae bacterium]
MAFAVNDGVRLFWRERGSGAPLLMIQGLGYPSDMWHHVEPCLAEHFRLILFDNRGVGRSDVPEGVYPLEVMAADAAAVLDAAGVEKAHVMGISMGGYIAQEFALRYPDRVRGLVLGCTSCGGEQAVPASQEVLDLVAARAHMSPEEGIRVLVPYIYSAYTPQEVIEADLAIRLRTYPDPKGYLGQLQGIYRWSSYERLGEIQAPTLILHGREDRLVPPENARILAEAIPTARLELLDRASHIFFSDRPQRTCELVATFLQEVG